MAEQVVRSQCHRATRDAAAKSRRRLQVLAKFTPCEENLWEVMGKRLLALRVARARPW